MEFYCEQNPLRAAWMWQGRAGRPGMGSPCVFLAHEREGTTVLRGSHHSFSLFSGKSFNKTGFSEQTEQPVLHSTGKRWFDIGDNHVWFLHRGQVGLGNSFFTLTVIIKLNLENSSIFGPLMYDKGCSLFLYFFNNREEIFFFFPSGPNFIKYGQLHLTVDINKVNFFSKCPL